jgi:hypothetical protein
MKVGPFACRDQEAKAFLLFQQILGDIAVGFAAMIRLTSKLFAGRMS